MYLIPSADWTGLNQKEIDVTDSGPERVGNNYAVCISDEVCRLLDFRGRHDMVQRDVEHPTAKLAR
jgi:hypothetical protein